MVLPSSTHEVLKCFDEPQGVKGGRAGRRKECGYLRRAVEPKIEVVDGAHQGKILRVGTVGRAHVTQLDPKGYGLEIPLGIKAYGVGYLLSVVLHLAESFL